MYLGATPGPAPDERFATEWFTFFFAPVIPLRRYRLRLLPHRGDGFSVARLERTPVVGAEIVRTYVFGWLLIPLCVASPAIAGGLVQSIFKLGESFGIAVAICSIAWLGVSIWKLMDWHQGRFHLPKP